MAELTIRVLQGINEVSAAEWDALTSPNDPFTEHAFLHALEESGSVGERSGWLPCHVVARDGGALVGACPAYLKANSYGEYIFDWAWANGAYNSGIRYYPKVVSAIPYTPATGRRLLVAPTHDPAEVARALLSGLHSVADATGASSIHFLFLTPTEQELLAREHEYLPRYTHQYHWHNKPWQSFEAYLADFRSPARKTAKKERSRAQALGYELVTLRGPELSHAQWKSLRRFYMSTIREKGAIPYLTQDFFRLLEESFSERVVVQAALRQGEAVAGSLSFQRGRHLYGRYWGALEDNEFLHFELCYYRPIELAIASGWSRFEAGAQGEHKIKRGLLPNTTYSAHWIRNEPFRDAIGKFVAVEAQREREIMEELASGAPFKRDE